MTDFSITSLVTLGQQPPLQVLFDDPCLIAVNKPAGILFQGHTKGLPTALDVQIKSYIREHKHGSKNVYLGIVHRLDRPVSGVVIVGRNSKFTARLAEQFQKRRVEKHYTAVVEGLVADDEGELIDDLPDEDDEFAKRCELKFKVIRRLHTSTVIDITLGTGRRNQIRRQFTKTAHPIVGDKKFGAKTGFPGFEKTTELFCPIALHAQTLTFYHPKTDEKLTITAPLPAYWDCFN